METKAEFIEWLKTKLNNQVAFDEVMRTMRSRYIMDRTTYKGPNFYSYGGGVIPAPWWALREHLRMHYKVYQEPTDVVRMLSDSLPPHVHLHISREDPQMVAYTPDREAGENDKQVRTSLGKFLRKYYPAWPDDQIGGLVADHMAELSNDIELLSGADIVAVYEGGTVSSCMAKTLWEKHPSNVYAAPNIYMAVVRDSNKRVTGRAMVYHASETDKRIIRAYGDAKLLKRLSRNDYKIGTWHGAQFNTVVLQKGEDGAGDKLLMPYLDGQGAGGGTSTSAIAYIDGKLSSITAEAFKALSSLDPSCVTVATNTNGYVTLKSIDSARFSKVCELSGETYSALDVATVTYFDGFNFYQASEDYLLEHMVPSSIKLHGASEDHPMVWAPAGIPSFRQGLYEYLDNTENRRRFHYVQLSSKHYPEDQNWFIQGRSSVVETYDEEYIREEDAIHLIKRVNGQIRLGYVHKSEEDFMWTRVHDIDSIKTYVDDEALIERTVSKRKVVMSVHDVSRMWDGQVDFSRNVTGFEVYGLYYDVSRRSPKPDTGPGTHFYNLAIDTLMWQGKLNDPDAVVYQMLRTHRAYLTSPVTRDPEVPTRGMADARHDVLYDKTWDEVYSRLSRPHYNEQQLAIWDAVNQTILRWRAEAEAVDYNADPALQGAANSTFQWVEPVDADGLTKKQRTLVGHAMQYLLQLHRVGRVLTTVDSMPRDDAINHYFQACAHIAHGAPEYKDLDTDKRMQVSAAIKARITEYLEACITLRTTLSPYPDVYGHRMFTLSSVVVDSPITGADLRESWLADAPSEEDYPKYSFNHLALSMTGERNLDGRPLEPLTTGLATNINTYGGNTWNAAWTSTTSLVFPTTLATTSTTFGVLDTAVITA